MDRVGARRLLYRNPAFPRNETPCPVTIRVYLDHAATSPLRPEARAAMAAGLDGWANPSSPHAEGRRARAMLEDARGRIAAALGWRGAVILTGGASEAIALAIGRAKASHVLVSPTEHDAVRRAAPDARVYDGTGGQGALLAVQAVNGETGHMPPPPAGPGPRQGLWLADCAQSAARLPLPDADFVVVSGHKLGAPAGIGALLVRDLATLRPTGGQEQGYRPGTENLPGALGLAAALEAPRDWLADAARWRAGLDAAIVDGGGEIVAGDRPRLATIASYRMPGVTSAAQLIRFDLAGIAVSAGSACSSGSLRTSPVLAALGWDARAAGEVVRVSFGWNTRAGDVERFAAEWRRIAGGMKRRAA